MLDADLYCKQALSMLQDEETYRVLERDPTSVFSLQLDHLLQEGVSNNAPVIPIFHG